MAPGETGFGINQGRIYANQGFVKSAVVSTDSKGNAAYAIVNPRAVWHYDIHLLVDGSGRQIASFLPLPMQTHIAEPTDLATALSTIASITSVRKNTRLNSSPFCSFRTPSYDW